MATKAYMLINVQPANTRGVFDQLNTIKGAVVMEVQGPYDLILDLEADTPEDILLVLRTKVRPIKGITNTVTCICL